MSDWSTYLRSRIFTSWGTVLYVDSATGQLRHGPVTSSPENAYFVADRDIWKSRPTGLLAHVEGNSFRPIARLTDQNISVVGADKADLSTQEITLNVVELERGLVGLEADRAFLSAEADGQITLSKSWCSTWEFFLLSEDWCSQLNEDTPVTKPHFNVNRRLLQSFIVDPRLRAAARKNSKAKKLLIYGYTQWSHGRVYYDLCKHLHARGYIVDILDWRGDHAGYVGEVLPYYDLYMTALDGVRTLVDSYGASFERIIALSHHELDMRMLIEQKGMEVFEKFANYAVVSEFLYCASQMMGIPRAPMVASLGVNFSEFYAEVPAKLEMVGYASSMSVKTYGVEWKRGELAETAAREAGLEFKVAGSTGNQISFHDMPEFYRSVDAVVNSSISEAAQLPVMEAAAAGRLVIGTPVGHFARRAYQGGGILAPVEAKKFKLFTTATLKHYKENPADFIEKCKAIQEAAQQFDWQYTIEEWVALIESARSSNSSRGKPAPLIQGEPRRAIERVTTADEPVSVLSRLDMVREFQNIKSADLLVSSSLCHVMTSFGSDKGSPYHNYTIVYDRLLSQFQTSSLLLFELGLGTNKVGAPSSMGAHGRPGASLRGWRAYFGNAEIFGADIDADILFRDDRIQTFWVDQRDPESIRTLWEHVGEITFDIMIDDGLHEASANICFLRESFSKLKSRGIYIIEDVTPQDEEQIASFVKNMSAITMGVVCESLQHPLNKVDNRLIIIQKQ